MPKSVCNKQERTSILVETTNTPTGLPPLEVEKSPATGRPDSRGAIESTVTGLGYELVEVERAPRGLLRVTIDRVPGKTYPGGDSEFVTVDDCELVTRQLQYALEVDGVAYERLEVSSPGLDRPLKTQAHFERFAGLEISLTLKQPFQGRKAYKGVLGQAESGWSLVFGDGKGQQQVLGFALDEVREARLVPVVDFKGRKKVAGPAQAAAPAALDGGQDR
jgi:ribosome maturation factor RimP